MSEYKRGLPPPIMDFLLGAISDPTGKPNDDEIQHALEQLAQAAAAICRVVPGKGMREKFEMIFAMEMERRFSPNEGQEEE